MDKKTLGIVLLIVGIIVAAIFVTADITGLGSHPVFGPTQIAGTVVGAIAFVVGIVLTRRK